HWRTTRTKRSKIPEYLWDKVKSLIEYYPLTAITNALRINTNQIRENIKIDTIIHFVEAKSAATVPIKKPIILPSTDTPTCSIELHRTSSGILKISVFPITSLSAIISQFME